MRIEPVIVIGAGPAVLATAIQLKRYGIHARVLERDQIGGLLRNANWVENYPGFPRGIRGVDLVRLFVEQARAASVEVTFDEVTELHHEDGLFRVVTRSRAHYAPVVAIASGTKPITLSDTAIPARLRDRVLYEVYPLTHMEGRRVAVIGAGDAAFDYALNLSRRNDVLILNRGEKTRCLPLLRERADACARIAYRDRTRLIELAEGPDGGLLIACESPQGISRIEVDYLIAAIGRVTQLDFASPSALRDWETGGQLYQVGDVKNQLFRQTAIAVGNGILAAMRISGGLGSGGD